MLQGGQILDSDGFERAPLQRVRKKMESPQHCHSEAPAFGARNLFFFGIAVEKADPSSSKVGVRDDSARSFRIFRQPVKIRLQQFSAS